MKHLKHLLPLAAFGFTAAAWSASEAGSSASSATSAASQSVGASSTSLRTSSNSSSNNNKVAAGDYTVIEVATADTASPAGEALARLTLRAAGSAAGQAGDVTLLLPQQVVEQAGLSAGDTVSVRHRAYGLEFAAGRQREAFFLVLDDAWYRELASTAVVL
jgi:hypothetical protein